MAADKASTDSVADALESISTHPNESVRERIDILLRDLEEVVGVSDIVKLIESGERDPHIYWGTATTGKPHFGYFLPMIKIGDFLQAGCHVTILFANLHACLDHEKINWTTVNARCEWYRFIIVEMLKLINVPLEKLHFQTGTDYQLTREYTLDMYRMTTLSSYNDCLRAGAEVVKMSENPQMSGLLYPILQALDEQYLDADIQFGGIDQRKIFMFAREALPKLGYRKRSHLMNPLIPSLTKDGKMSASDPSSRLDFDDSPNTIRSKIRGAFAAPGVVDNNGLLAIMRFILFRWLEQQQRSFRIERDVKWGGPVEYVTYYELESAFSEKKLAPADLKLGVGDILIEFLEPLRDVVSRNAFPQHSS